MRLDTRAARAAGLAGLALLPASAAAIGTKQPKNAILLSNVQAITVYAGRMTTHRRVPAVPQLSCTATPQRICELYTVDAMRCTNQGSGYDDQDIQWSCTAALPPELKLGSTDVVCEGYSSAADPYVLRGSCAVEYRLLLTDYGEQRYPELAGSGTLFGTRSNRASWFFWLAFVAIVAWILFRASRDNGAVPGNNGRRRTYWPGSGGGGFWGGGGGGPGFGPGNDPPPPYPGNKPWGQQEGWQPGFWTGLAGGAAAGYAAGRNRNNAGYYDNAYGSGYGRPRVWGGYGSGAPGPSRRSGSPSSRPVSSARVESTGFGSTRRR